MAVHADLGVDVEVVEHAELARQRMGVGRHAIAKQTQRRIAVAALEVAENLIVRAVLADDVEHVLDRRHVADAPWDRRADRGVRRRQPDGVAVRRDAAHRVGERRERLAGRRTNERQRARQHHADVLPVGAAADAGDQGADDDLARGWPWHRQFPDLDAARCGVKQRVSGHVRPDERDAVALEPANSRQAQRSREASRPRAHRDDHGIRRDRLTVDGDTADGAVPLDHVVDDADSQRGATRSRGVE